MLQTKRGSFKNEPLHESLKSYKLILALCKQQLLLNNSCDRENYRKHNNAIH